ncbi:SUKH-4 family immunity protein [Streptomyces sp. NPDC048663]|uniref:SUKH-4 family immunity protein n=1 Tax=Streptomyces sp. NPDC048663 TaxID=3155638 RepID=UPI00341F6CDF
MALFYEGLTYEDLVDWAGERGVTRARSSEVGAWRIPDADKAVLMEVGVPRTEDTPLTRVCFQREPQPSLPTVDGRWLYRVAENHLPIVPGSALTSSWGVEPDTGTVHYVQPDGEPWFANSTVVLWVQSLHHYGLRVDTCDLLLNPDDHEEDAVLAELEELAAELEELDPPAFAGYRGYIWAEFLSRWLW